VSKRKAVFARDLRVGDTIRLVYEIEVTSIDDLDTKLPCESSDLFFIKGNVTKGPLRGRGGEFAINGENKLDVRLRKSFWSRLKTRIDAWSSPPSVPMVTVKSSPLVESKAVLTSS